MSMVFVILLILACVLAPLAAIAYEASKEAKRNRKAFEPKPQTPTDEDMNNLMRKYSNGNPPAFLIRQAD